MLFLKNIIYQYPNTQFQLMIDNLIVEKGQIVSVLGESGSGKSSLLKLIYGLLEWEQGGIVFNNKPLMGLNKNIIPGEKDMKLVNQSFDLSINEKVSENIGYFLSNFDLEKKNKRINELLKVMGLEKYKDMKPKSLSGGQQQRVSIARAIAIFPKLLLLDEPFNQIDPFLRHKLREKLFGYIKRKKITTFISTHDKDDAMAFSDYMIIMRNGKIIQQGTPKDLYFSPKNLYVARLFGEVNRFNNLVFNQIFEGESYKKFIYPLQILVTEDNLGEGKVINCFFKGDYYLVTFKVGNQMIKGVSKQFIENNKMIKYQLIE